jgi:subtilisin-like proprotein convertase family protein
MDIIGKWNGSGGGGVEYYNAYTGTYAGMSAVSSTDEFIFNNDGSYLSMYRSASTNNSGTQFGSQDFRGSYSVTDWTITVDNRFGGKKTTFNSQLIAVKNGYLLFMSDSENPSMQYTLYRTK